MLLQGPPKGIGKDDWKKAKAGLYVMQTLFAEGAAALMVMGAPDVDKQAIIADIKDYEKTRYHQPSDVVTPDWNWEGPTGLARLGIVMGMRLANADTMPAWLTNSPFNRKRGTDEPPPPEP